MSQLPPLPPPGQPLQYATPYIQDGGPNIRAIAIAQRRIMWVILAAIIMSISLVGGTAITPGSGPAEFVVIGLLTIFRLGVLVIMMIMIFQLSKALGNGTTSSVLAVIAMIIPCVSLIVLLVLNQNATNTLKRAGIRVGLMGANLSQLPPA